MPTLTAVWDAATASVKLRVSDRAGVQAILRTDVNGTRPVRLPGEKSLPGIGDATFIDHEVALGGKASYRLDHKDFTVPVWVNTLQNWNRPFSPRFLLPFTPAIYATAEAVTSYDAAMSSRVTFHDVIGRPGPLVVEGDLSTRRGKMGVYFPDLTAASGLVELLRRGKTVMYRQSEHPGMDMYFHTEDVSLAVDPENGRRWTVTVSYVEIEFPLGDISSTAGWTFDAARQAFWTFTEMSQRHDTFKDLALGETHD